MPGISDRTKMIDKIVAVAEKKSDFSVAVCAKSWHLPIYKQILTYGLATSRRQTPLEEYIMRAADMKLSYDVDVSMLPSLLGLDEIFLDWAVDNLAEKGILDKECLPVLKLTESGKSYLLSATLPDEERGEQLEYYIDRKSALVYAKPVENSSYPMHPEAGKIDKIKENAKKYINRKFLFRAAQVVGKELENEDEGTKVTSVISAKTIGLTPTLFTEICMYDIKQNSFFVKVYDYAAGGFRDDISEFLVNENINSGYTVSSKRDDSITALIRESALKCKKTELFEIYRGHQKEEKLRALAEGASDEIIVLFHGECKGTAAEYVTDCVLSAAAENKNLRLRMGFCMSLESKTGYDESIQKISEVYGDNVFFFDFEDNVHLAVEIIIDGRMYMVDGVRWAVCNGEFSGYGDVMYRFDDEYLINQRTESLKNILPGGMENEN